MCPGDSWMLSGQSQHTDGHEPIQVMEDTLVVRPDRPRGRPTGSISGLVATEP